MRAVPDEGEDHGFPKRPQVVRRDTRGGFPEPPADHAGRWRAGGDGRRLASRRGRPLAASPYSTTEKPNTYEQITNYNNYYEFGLGKTDPAAKAGSLTTSPWQVKVERDGRQAGDL